MPRRMMDRAMYDGRNPYGSEGGYVVSSRRRRRGGRRDRAMNDMGMNYGYGRDYRGSDMEYGSRQGDRAYSQQDYERGRRDYEQSGQSDMARGDYGDMRDMHHMGRSGGYRPVEAMGYFTGYYGGGEDMARGGRGRDYGDYNYDMRGRDYGYDYGYDYGDYGENLSREELEHWKKKLMKEVEDKDKPFFETSNIEQRAKQVGAEMKDYTPEELALTTAMAYTDYCKTIRKYVGNNMEIYVEIAKDWLEDKDSAVKGGEKLAIYHDCIVEGEDD